MRKKHLVVALGWLSFLVLPGSVHATTFNYHAFLNGLSSAPSNASPATGLGTVVLNDVAGTITVDES